MIIKTVFGKKLYETWQQHKYVYFQNSSDVNKLHNFIQIGNEYYREDSETINCKNMRLRKCFNKFQRKNLISIFKIVFCLIVGTVKKFV